MSLTDVDASKLAGRMNEIRRYIDSGHIYKDECLYSLYSLFILDLLNIESRTKNQELEYSGHTVDLFLRFLRLLTANYISHHDISFYADSLAVTPIYLSRIVKRFSGQTVKNHVDRLLVMEASYLLASTDYSVARIGEMLSFATPASFCKFFARHKGMTPKEYRISGPFSGARNRN